MASIIITGGNSDIAKATEGILKTTFPKRDIIRMSRSVLDVTIQEEVDQIIGQFKPHILINCAGYIAPQPIISSVADSWHDEMMVNLYGAYLVSRAAVRNNAHMIINIGSSAGRKGKAGWSGYCASKAGLISLTQSLAAEGHNAYCVSPGRTNTKMRKGLFPKEDVSTLLPPSDVADLIVRVIKKEFTSGSNIEISRTDEGTKIKEWKM